jgi:hypothetical protein
MAVLHHAFRCPVTPAFERYVFDVLEASRLNDSEKLSAMAKGSYEALRYRADIQAAFHLDPEGGAPSWLEPQFISSGLAALVMLAPSFEPLPTLSASDDTNHDRLSKHLPALGWSAADVCALVHGASVEAMLETYAQEPHALVAGGFGHTGGWVSPPATENLVARLEKLAAKPRSTSNSADAALLDINDTGALQDARAMLNALRAGDWLVTAITH